jgi:hypothetical protein
MGLLLCRGEYASGWNVGVAGREASLAFKWGVGLIVATPVAEVSTFQGGELQKEKGADAFGIEAGCAAVSLVGESNDDVSLLEDDCGGKTVEGLSGKGAGRLGPSTGGAWNHTEGTHRVRDVAEGNVDGDIAVWGAGREGVEDGKVGVERLVMDGLVVENFASALVEDVVEFRLGSLNGLDEGTDLGKHKDGAPGF